MNIRKAIAHLALAIAVLGAQHAAIVHVMSHLVSAPEHAAQLERQPTGLAAELCEIRVGFAQLGGTIYGAAPHCTKIANRLTRSPTEIRKTEK
jgi:hypothetical protein